MKKITLLFYLFFSSLLLCQEKLTEAITENYYTDEFGTNGKWEATNRTEYNYDDSGNLLKSETFSLNENKAFYKSAIHYYRYDEKNRLIENYSDSKYEETENFIRYEKINQKFDDDGNVVEYFYSEWNDENNEWIVEEKTYITYIGGKVTDCYNDSKNEDGTWEKDSRYIFSYTPENKVKEILYQILENNTWADETKKTYAYNTNGSISEFIRFYGGGNGDKFEYTYDSTGNKVKSQGYSFEEEKWRKYSSSEVFKFDDTKLMPDNFHPFKDLLWEGENSIKNHSFVNKIIEESSDDEDLNIVPQRTRYIYEANTANLVNYNLLDIKVYPNPTSSFVIIDDSNFVIKSIALFNVLGKKIFTSTENKIHTENLVNGIYLLKVQSESGEIATKRIIKK